MSEKDSHHRTDCLICGTELVYTEISQQHRCVYCGKEFESQASCAKGHYVCDTCHSADAAAAITSYCAASESTDVIAMANDLMRHPAVNMHGPEHHYLVPAVLISAYYNFKNEKDKKSTALEEARTRAAKVPGGSCGLMGNCGAGVGTGIFMSIITGATPLTKTEWKKSIKMTARSLDRIADQGGPRCCKRSVFTSLASAVEYVRRQVDHDFPESVKPVCGFYGQNRECLNKECPYFAPAIKIPLQIKIGGCGCRS